MTKPLVRLKFVSFFPGFDAEMCRSHVLMDLCSEFDFVMADDPDILLVGCYGQDSFSAGQATTVGYYTENLAPDLANFDFFFGCEYTDIVADPKYCKRVFGPVNQLAFDGIRDPEASLRGKTHFCNFVYSNRIPFRERFFRELSKVRPVSAPGKSMNNCSDLNGSKPVEWQREKTDYLRKFKFTISFENSRRIGYTTEKLYDALRVDTVPVYWGDPLVDRVVNPDALVILDSDWEREVVPWLHLPERRLPYRPYTREPTFRNRAFGRANDFFHWLRGRVPYRKGFGGTIEEMLWLDSDDDAYMRKLAQPRVKTSVLKMRTEYFAKWRAIIGSALARRQQAI